MTDVRLTATNPDDSSVVPVACNAKGELLLEDLALSADDFVAKSGDNMTGDLTLGNGTDDKITLDATAGSGTFKGLVQSENADGSTFSYISPNGSIGGTGNIQMSTYMKLGGDKVVLNEAGVGGGIFKGNVVVSDGTSGQAVLFPNGLVRAYQQTEDGSNTFFLGSGGGGNTEKFRVKCDGTASFAGEVLANEVKVRNPVTSGANLVSNSWGGTPGSNLWGFVQVAGNGNPPASIQSNGVFQVYDRDTNTYPVSIFHNGSATFFGEVVVGSRSKQWMLLEQGGLCHMVEQQSLKDGYPELRNVIQELDLIEKALGEVMEKLRMSPPAGWPVWDGSSENS